MRQTLVKARQLKSEWNEERRREIALEIDRMREEEEEEEEKLVDVFNIVLSAHVRTRTIENGKGNKRKEKRNVDGFPNDLSESQPLSPDRYLSH